MQMPFKSRLFLSVFALAMSSISFAGDFPPGPSMPLTDVSNYKSCTIKASMLVVPIDREATAYLNINCDDTKVSEGHDVLGFFNSYPSSLKTFKNNWINHLQSNGFKVSADCSNNKWVP